MAIYHKVPRGELFKLSRLTRLWRKFFPLPCYVIVYDDENQDTEEYYGYFNSPQEAKECWDRFAICREEANDLRPFTNVKLCRIVENLT